MKTMSLSLPALTGEQVYDLSRKRNLYEIAISAASGIRAYTGVFASGIVEQAKQYAKENELVFEHNLLVEFVKQLVDDAATRFSDKNTIAEIRHYYGEPLRNLSQGERPAFMNS